MKALYYSRFGGPISVENLPDPQPPENGVVIKVEASGVCLSDWHGWMGHDPDIKLPHVPGHEFSGTLLEVGKGVKRWKAGQRVTVPFVCGCGACIYCREGNQQVCNHQFQPGFTAWGSFAEYVAIDYADNNLVELPEDLDFISAASLGCRFVTAFRALIDQARLQAGQWVAVHGCGGVGLSAIQIAKATGANVIAIDITDEKCALAFSMGAAFAVNARKGEVISKIMELSGGGVHVSMDALGSTETCLNSINSLRKGGKHLQIGLMPLDDGKAVVPMAKVIANELQIIGSHGMQAHRYKNVFEFIRSAGLHPGQMVKQTISLEDGPEKLAGLPLDHNMGITIILL